MQRLWQVNQPTNKPIPLIDFLSVGRFHTSYVKEVCCEWNRERDKDGYGIFWYRTLRYRAHRVSWFLETKIEPSELKVLHACDNPRCVNPVHLFLGTDLDNQIDRRLKGKGNEGIRNPKSKLTCEDVIEIRRLYFEVGMTQEEIAGLFPVSRANIGHIVRGKLWTHKLS